MYDIDGNGELDLEEITYIIDMMDNLEGRVGGEVVINDDFTEDVLPTSKERAMDIYKKLDYDHDGVITLEEFVKVGHMIFEY